MGQVLGKIQEAKESIATRLDLSRQNLKELPPPFSIAGSPTNFWWGTTRPWTPTRKHLSCVQNIRSATSQALKGTEEKRVEGFRPEVSDASNCLVCHPLWFGFGLVAKNLASWGVALIKYAENSQRHPNRPLTQMDYHFSLNGRFLHVPYPMMTCASFPEKRAIGPVSCFPFFVEIATIR